MFSVEELALAKLKWYHKITGWLYPLCSCEKGRSKLILTGRLQHSRSKAHCGTWNSLLCTVRTACYSLLRRAHSWLRRSLSPLQNRNKKIFLFDKIFYLNICKLPLPISQLKTWAPRISGVRQVHPIWMGEILFLKESIFSYFVNKNLVECGCCINGDSEKCGN